TILTIGNGGEAKVVLQKTSKGKTIQRRSTGWATIMKAPMEKVLKRLKERGFCTGEGEPTAKGLWTSLDADQIIQLYSSVNPGLPRREPGRHGCCANPGSSPNSL